MLRARHLADGKQALPRVWVSLADNWAPCEAFILIGEVSLRRNAAETIVSFCSETRAATRSDHRSPPLPEVAMVALVSCIAEQHNFPLLSVAGCFGVAGDLAAVIMLSRARHCVRVHRNLWLIVTSFVLGGTI